MKNVFDVIVANTKHLQIMLSIGITIGKTANEKDIIYLHHLINQQIFFIWDATGYWDLLFYGPESFLKLLRK